jgi:hypothetical protein
VAKADAGVAQVTSDRKYVVYNAANNVITKLGPKIVIDRRDLSSGQISELTFQVPLISGGEQFGSADFFDGLALNDSVAVFDHRGNSFCENDVPCPTDRLFDAPTESSYPAASLETAIPAPHPAQNPGAFLIANTFAVLGTPSGQGLLFVKIPSGRTIRTVFPHDGQLRITPTSLAELRGSTEFLMEGAVDGATGSELYELDGLTGSATVWMARVPGMGSRTFWESTSAVGHGVFYAQVSQFVAATAPAKNDVLRCEISSKSCTLFAEDAAWPFVISAR